MGKILETTPPPKTKLCNCMKKENCSRRGACLTKNILYYGRISCDDEIYIPKLYKGICEKTFKKLLKNVTQIKKNLSMREKTRTILNYLLNTGNWQIRNFTHGYPGA